MNDDNAGQLTPPENQKPSDFKVQVTQITDTNALLNWNAAIDPDGDDVIYSVVLGVNEVWTKLEMTEFVLEGLTPQTDYIGKIIASDGN